MKSIYVVYGAFFSVGIPHFTSPACAIPDSLAFMVIVGLAIKATFGTLRVLDILRMVVRDALVCFVAIFTSHFVLVVTLSHARASATVTSVIGAFLKPQRLSIQLLLTT